MEKDIDWMNRALELAKGGRGKVSPNPMVGAVIVKNGKCIGEGYHKLYGGAHAEVCALDACKEDPKGATIYVTLEPCCHFGKTPPCTQAIIQAGIKRVVVGACDPNPLVSGKGIEALRTTGITVDVGILEEDCIKLNHVFFHYIQTKTPYVILKAAMSLDGKIATKTGESKWITGELAREHGHSVRGNVKAIMVGIGTVLADDPMLTCRIGENTTTNPIRIVIDKHLKIPLDSKLVKTATKTPFWVVCAETEPRFNSNENPQTYTDNKTKEAILEANGVILLRRPLQADGQIDLNDLMHILAEKQIDSLLIEGGGSLNDSALAAGIVSEVNFYIAPMIIGGETAKNGISGSGRETLALASRLKGLKMEPLGDDWLITAKVI